MSVKIRLQRHGRRKNPFYHIVIADSRAPRDGKYIEKIGTYNPMTVPATIDLDRDKAFDWLMKGAQPTDTVRAMLRLKGVLYRKHLMRGVQKGALTEEDAMTKYEEWIADKEARLQIRADKTAQEKRNFHQRMSGKAAVVVEEPEEVESTAEEAVEEVTEEVKEAAETVQETAEEVVEEAKESAEDAETVVDKVVDKAKDLAEDAKEAAEELVEDTKEVLEDVKEEVAEVAEDVVEAAKELAEDTKEVVEDAIDKVKDALSPEEKEA